MTTDDPRPAVYSALLEHCPKLPVLEQPWDVLLTPPGCRGPVRNPAAALARLLRTFGEDRLARAGVVRERPGHEAELAPDLVDPAGALVPLRGEPDGAPFALLTPRGLRPAGPSPVEAALRDAWTAGRVRERGALFVTADVRDLVLLRAVGLPATLGLWRGRPTEALFRSLDAGFAPPDFPPAAGARPVLVLVAWGPREVSDAVPPGLASAAQAIAEARRHLGLPLAGVTAWRPRPADLEGLRYRLDLRSAPLVREWFRAAVDAQADVETLLPAPAPAVGSFGATNAALLEALAAGSPAVPQARAEHEAAVRRDLVQPLMDEALACPDALTRAVGVELAGVTNVLHLILPYLLGGPGWGPEGAQASGLFPEMPFRQYVALSARAGNLTRDVARLRGL